MIKITTMAMTSAMIATMNIALAASASAAYDPASSYTGQFSSPAEHVSVKGATLEQASPSVDYIDSFSWKKATTKRSPASWKISYDRSTDFINRVR